MRTFTNQQTPLVLSSALAISLNLSIGIGLSNAFESCSQSSLAAFNACRHETKDDYWILVGNCMNLDNPRQQDRCFDLADDQFLEERRLCREQKQARLDVCDDLGEAPYNPEMDPQDFVDFDAVLAGGTFNPNPYFPLISGLTLDYEVFSGDGTLIEKIKMEVLDETKDIMGINCLVVHDRVWEIESDGEEVLIEDTHDWYGQDLAGNVWYMGEIVLNYEEGELDNLDGSWIAGKDFAKAGYLMLAQPTEGTVYRQEFYLGDAEDMGKIISVNAGSVAVPYGSFQNNVLKTEDWTPIEPDVVEYKYYAPGIGMVKETKPDDSEQVVLVNVTGP